MERKRTFSLIKPGAIAKNYYGEIIRMIVDAGFGIKAIKMVHLTVSEAEQFYGIHKGKDFFERLTLYMSSGPIIALVLEKEDAVEKFRELIGATDPSKAAEGTVRQRFGENITNNAVHGADSYENAEKEWSFFFARKDIVD